MVVSVVDAMITSLQSHALTILENLTVFKLSLKGALRQAAGKCGYYIKQFGN
ncbi:MAG: hypothetical protein UV20_C0029G0008 [Candidatus Magasanikbacteria bacterium GW2011_GWA2_42_32]|uniref:Uncharacterized protein n=1 Tax=Candidatus Magasanikbacteria bacterium GW2011_GWA2_42_32 TaxID=1619039 RepID=A0A0G1A1P6_9BACT|nr:MAG: hypothetical protein UV20_C0029G0008 [Candidatus Magasanikbacteria bacterium GW2011_GWA2_42_32]